MRKNSLDFDVLLRDALKFAQGGRIDEARNLTEQIRGELKVEDFPSVAAMIMAIEAICFEYLGDNKSSKDKILRASVISERYSDSSTRQFVASWLALIQYNAGNIGDALKTLSSLYGNIKEADGEVRFRVASVLAVIAAYLGLRSAEHVWFNLARAEASKCGNANLTSILLYSVASARISANLVDRMHFSESSAFPDFSADLLYLRSAENYDHLVGAKNQPGLHKLLQAQCLVLMGKFDVASRYLDFFLDKMCPTRETEYVKARFERAWCKLGLGEFDEDASDFSKLLAILEDPDDLSIAHCTLSEIYSYLGDSDLAGFHLTERERYRSEFLKERAMISRDFADYGFASSPSGWLPN